MIFEEDKQMHAGAGFLVALSIFGVSSTTAFILVCIAGFGKEIIDSFCKEKHTPDIADALVTIGAGAITIQGITWIRLLF